LKKPTSLTFAILLFAAYAWGQTPVSVPRSYNQFWQDIDIFYAIKPKIDVNLDFGLREKTDFNRTTDHYTELLLFFKPNKHVSFGPGYRYQRLSPVRERLTYEHRLMLHATLSFDLPKKLRLSDRSLYEYRWRSSRPDTARYRNRIVLERPFRLAQRTFTPYIMEEVFYDFSLDKFSRNRLAVGVKKRLAKHFTLDLHLMRQSDGTIRPGDLNVIGSNLRFNF
jgi:hypothetical protein